MRLGIFAKTFAGQDPVTVMSAARAAGYASVQYNLACSGLPSMPDTLPESAAEAVGAASATTGIAIAALSGTYNMIHPDPRVRATGLRRLTIVLDAACAMGAPMVTLCTGTRDPEDQWRGHPDNGEPEAWRDLLREMESAADLADARGLTLGIEPERANVVDSALKARRLLDDIRSPSLAIVLDPANLFEVEEPQTRADIISRAIDLLGDRIAMAHAKDRDRTGRFVTAGQGVVDFSDFIFRLRGVGFDGDLVTHGLEPDDAPQVARLLSDLIVQ